jgi:hypothetical protein
MPSLFVSMQLVPALDLAAARLTDLSRLVHALPDLAVPDGLRERAAIQSAAEDALHEVRGLAGKLESVVALLGRRR